MVAHGTNSFWELLYNSPIQWICAEPHKNKVSLQGKQCLDDNVDYNVDYNVDSEVMRFRFCHFFQQLILYMEKFLSLFESCLKSFRI